MLGGQGGVGGGEEVGGVIGAGGVGGAGGAAGNGRAAGALTLDIRRAPSAVQIAVQEYQGQPCTVAVYDLAAVVNNRDAVLAAHSSMASNDKGWTLVGMVYTNEGKAHYGASETVEYWFEAEQMQLTHKCYDAIQTYLTVHHTALMDAHTRGQPHLRVLTGWSLILENFKQNLVPHMMVETWCMQHRKLDAVSTEDVCTLVNETLAMMEGLLRQIQAPSSLPPSWPAHQTLAGISKYSCTNSVAAEGGRQEQRPGSAMGSRPFASCGRTHLLEQPIWWRDGRGLCPRLRPVIAGQGGMKKSPNKAS